MEAEATVGQRHTTWADVDEVEADLAAVEEALARLDAGTYDSCEACGRTLGDDVLEAEPIARRCPPHA